MIFDTNYTSGSSYNNMKVKPSPYPLGLEGALMHVYENECNYNAIMKAVGISEMRYYQETGKDLLIQEAGAFSGFIAKAKAFFKKVIEKIKQIFHKFIAVINQYKMSDHDFVKKYEKELYRKDLKDFEFKGYSFKNLDEYGRNIGGKCAKIMNDMPLEPNDFMEIPTMNINGIEQRDSAKGGFRYSKGNVRSSKDFEDDFKKAQPYTSTTDESNTDISGDIEKACDIIRGALVDSASVDKDDFIEELKEILYGETEKEDIEIKSIRDWVGYISNTKEDLKTVDSAQKAIIGTIDKMIKNIENAQSKYGKVDATERKDQAEFNAKNNIIKAVSGQLDVYRSASNDMTTMFGILSQAYKDRNRQAKAICVKALSYKHESANLYNESTSYTNDLFAGVVIK